MSLPEKGLFNFPQIVQEELSRLNKEIEEKEALISENNARILLERDTTLPKLRANLKQNKVAHEDLLLKRADWVNKHGEAAVASAISDCVRNIHTAEAVIEMVRGTIATSESNVKLAQEQLKELERIKQGFLANKVQLYSFFLDNKPTKYILAISEKKEASQLSIPASPQIRRT